jgi:hypothetical protein
MDGLITLTAMSRCLPIIIRGKTITVKVGITTTSTAVHPSGLTSAMALHAALAVVGTQEASAAAEAIVKSAT